MYENSFIIKAAAPYLNMINNAVINIDDIFLNDSSEYKRKRRSIITKIGNLRRQQKLYLLLAVSFDLKLEKRLWQLRRTKCFWEVDCVLFSEENFKENFRMNRSNFQTLCNLLSDTDEGELHWRRIPLEKKVAIALYCLGSSAEYRSIANLFGVGKSTVCVILLQFCKMVWNKLRHTHLSSFPLTKQKIEECVRGFEKFGFPQCLGAIDGCHIEVHPRAPDAIDYYNYKGWYSIVLFALVDHRCRFLYFNIGSPGRCNDSQIFENSILKEYLNDSPLLDQMSKRISEVDVPILLIGDSAFQLTRRVMKPYPFKVECEMTKKAFNYTLSRSRRVVENAFGHIKARFRRLGKGIDNTVENANDVVKACCILHNFLNDNNDQINLQWVNDIQPLLEKSKITQPENFLMTASNCFFFCKCSRSR